MFGNFSYRSGFCAQNQKEFCATGFCMKGFYTHKGFCAKEFCIRRNFKQRDFEERDSLAEGILYPTQKEGFYAKGFVQEGILSF